MSILTSIGQGDHYFDNQVKKYGLDPEKIVKQKDGSLHYMGSVNFSYYEIRDLIEEIPIKFDYVSGSFNCCGCCNLKSLKNAPLKVDGSFDCSSCLKLTSLEGAPEEIGGDFSFTGCSNVNSIEGMPKKIGGYIYCNSKFSGKNEICKIMVDMTANRIRDWWEER